MSSFQRHRKARSMVEVKRYIPLEVLCRIRIIMSTFYFYNMFIFKHLAFLNILSHSYGGNSRNNGINSLKIGVKWDDDMPIMTRK